MEYNKDQYNKNESVTQTFCLLTSHQPRLRKNQKKSTLILVYKNHQTILFQFAVFLPVRCTYADFRRRRRQRTKREKRKKYTTQVKNKQNNEAEKSQLHNHGQAGQVH